jgi:hypothetical protein
VYPLDAFSSSLSKLKQLYLATKVELAFLKDFNPHLAWSVYGWEKL